jgi:hypothetical protein
VPGSDGVERTPLGGGAVGASSADESACRVPATALRCDRCARACRPRGVLYRVVALLSQPCSGWSRCVARLLPMPLTCQTISRSFPPSVSVVAPPATALVVRVV